MVYLCKRGRQQCPPQYNISSVQSEALFDVGLNSGSGNSSSSEQFDELSASNFVSVLNLGQVLFSGLTSLETEDVTSVINIQEVSCNIVAECFGNCRDSIAVLNEVASDESDEKNSDKHDVESVFVGRVASVLY